MSNQTEEKYWTDYVRVATPIVGLLLLLGVFWYWANSLIGADSEEPPPTTAASVTVVPAPTSTPTVVPTQGVESTSEAIVPTATKQPVEPSPTEAEPPTPTTAEETPVENPEGRFAENETILSADDGVNMRAEPSTDAEIVEVLSLDQELTVINGQPEENGGFVWWNVRSNDTGNEGWVVDDWLKKQE